MKKQFNRICLRKSLIGLMYIAISTLSAEPNVFTWQDGDRQQVVHLNPNFVAEIQNSSKMNQERLIRILPISDTKLKLALLKGTLPKSLSNTHSEVFEENRGGRKMTLPGDIFIEFTCNWDEAKVKEWADTHKLILIGKLNSNKNIYRIQTSPGRESLHLANRLLANPEVKSAFPNWWRESVGR